LILDSINEEFRRGLKNMVDIEESRGKERLYQRPSPLTSLIIE
jgi:hypothetical protein